MSTKESYKPAETKVQFEAFSQAIEAQEGYNRPEVVSFSSPDGEILTAGINHVGTPAALAMATSETLGIPTREFYLDEEGIQEVLTWLGKHNVFERKDHPTAEALKMSSLVLVRVIKSEADIKSIQDPDYREYWQKIYADVYEWCNKDTGIMQL